MPNSGRLHPLKESWFGIWTSRARWSERIISFNASWFVTSMGTGVVVQVLTNFPYHSQWLRNVAYCFWVLDVVMFLLFSALGVVRWIRYPQLSKTMFQDFYQMSYVGAIPITLDTIVSGIVIFYPDRPAAVWAAFTLFWTCILGGLLVGGVMFFVTCSYQTAQKLSSINATWLLAFIPFIVTAATGSILIPTLPFELQGFTIVTTFLIWNIGIIMSMFILVIYVWRLLRYKLPARDAIVSCFIPIGPTAMSGYGIHNLSIAFASYIHARSYTLVLETGDPTKQSSAQVATVIHWIGVLISLCLVAFATFWLLQATLSILFRPPKIFNVGFWSFVFPVGVYANALCLLSHDLDNHGLRGWAATVCVTTILLWCLCAACTIWKAVWHAELLFAPGLEGWNERKALGLEQETDTSKQASRLTHLPN